MTVVVYFSYEACAFPAAPLAAVREFYNQDEINLDAAAGGQNEDEITNQDGFCSGAQMLGNVLLLRSDCPRHVRTEKPRS
jgi:predicted nucleic acid-binding Zn finger protein